MTTPKKVDSSATEPNNLTSEFGGRVLGAKDNVFAHNAWDHAEWTSDQEEKAQVTVARQKEGAVPEADQQKYHLDAAGYWDAFYTSNQNRFFKDRRWLRVEFPEVFAKLEADPKQPCHVMEIGCGAGNAFFPLLDECSEDSGLFAYACDFSATAVDIVQKSPKYDPRRCKAFVWDLASPTLPAEVEPHSIDIILLVFVFSALHPDQWDQAIKNLTRLLRPGGLVMFRDYGRYDLAQLRFKQGRLLSDNFYIRGDGTRVYFFTNDEIGRLFSPHFEILQNAVDRRLIVNRHKQLKMYRVWLQGKFRWSPDAQPSETQQ
ncbi:hypothetical protein IWQ62_005845 [Dispira parvispora]|uniref:tRNA N(3)-methylcytidine methyltransferase n=1 Tax=Dispira parvispora TaxID=1520584 RepID=A0A9W8AP57_9FUNG|nr:hypothetical protein IWQ62_005845 [Dispira parvispora]